MNFGEGFINILKHQEDKGVRAVLKTFEDLGFIYFSPEQDILLVSVSNTVDLPNGGYRKIHMTQAVSIQMLNHTLEKNLNDGSMF